MKTEHYDNDTSHDFEPLDGSIQAIEHDRQKRERIKVEAELQRLWESEHDDFHFEKPISN